MATGRLQEGLLNSDSKVQEAAVPSDSSIEEVLKRLSWAAISVPSPNIDPAEFKKTLVGLKPEELLKVRAMAAQLENHHARILDYLQVILEMVYSNGYISPVRVK